MVRISEVIRKNGLKDNEKSRAKIYISRTIKSPKNLSLCTSYVGPAGPAPAFYLAYPAAAGDHAYPVKINLLS
jgi:hypothetical protein